MPLATIVANYNKGIKAVMHVPSQPCIHATHLTIVPGESWKICSQCLTPHSVHTLVFKSTVLKSTYYDAKEGNCVNIFSQCNGIFLQLHMLPMLICHSNKEVH